MISTLTLEILQLLVSKVISNNFRNKSSTKIFDRVYMYDIHNPIPLVTVPICADLIVIWTLRHASGVCVTLVNFGCSLHRHWWFSDTTCLMVMTWDSLLTIVSYCVLALQLCHTSHIHSLAGVSQSSITEVIQPPNSLPSPQLIWVHPYLTHSNIA